MIGRVLSLSFLVVGACGGAQPALPAPTLMCDVRLEELDQRSRPVGSELPAGPVASIEIQGARTVPEALVREAIRTPLGQDLDAEQIRSDLRDILALSVFEDVRVHGRREGDRVMLRYEVMERPLVRHVEARGEALPRGVGRLGLLTGEVFVPQRIHRLAGRIAAEYRRDGYRDARVELRAHRDDGVVDLCFLNETGRRWLIERFEFSGNELIADAELRDQLDTQDGEVNHPGGIYREDLLDRGLERVRGLYLARGMVEVVVHVPQVTWSGERASVEIAIAEGAIYRIGNIEFEGSLAESAEHYRGLVGVEPGEVFVRPAVTDGIERIRTWEREQGRETDVTVIETTLDREGSRLHMVIRLAAADATEPPESAPEGPTLFDQEAHIDLPRTEP
ncbi:MAG: POTRA domain-containing protein [Myxococcota bacterium]